MARSLFIIGMGTGNPRHMTLEGLDALKAADRVFIPTKGVDKAELAAIRRAIVETHGPSDQHIVEFALPVRDADNPDYACGVHDWHGAIAEHYADMIGAMAPDQCAALLVWGDPGLYDSTLRILETVRGKGLDFSLKVLPGITAIQALTAAFAIPLNTIGNPVTITTGRKLLAGWPEGADTVIVMLDGQKAYASIAPEGVDIYWAAYVGMDQQILISGPLTDVREKISAARDGAREKHGWIMDVYLLRRTE